MSDNSSVDSAHSDTSEFANRPFPNIDIQVEVDPQAPQGLRARGAVHPSILRAAEEAAQFHVEQLIEERRQQFEELAQIAIAQFDQVAEEEGTRAATHLLIRQNCLALMEVERLESRINSLQLQVQQLQAASEPNPNP